MSQIISFPPAIQRFFQIALSPSIETNSLPCPAKSRSKSVAVTSIVSFAAKRAAVSLRVANTTGRALFNSSSRSSRMCFSCSSILSQIGWRSSKGNVSTCWRSSAIASLSGAIVCAICWRTWSISRRSPSLSSCATRGISSLIFFRIGCTALRSRVDLSPKTFFKNVVKDIWYVVLF